MTLISSCPTFAWACAALSLPSGFKHSNILSCGSVIDLSHDHAPACQATTATLSNILPSRSVQRSLGLVLRCLCLRALKHPNILSNILPSGSAFGLCLWAPPSGSAFGLCLRALRHIQTFSIISLQLLGWQCCFVRAACGASSISLVIACGARGCCSPLLSLSLCLVRCPTSAWCLTLGWPRQTLVVCLWCPRVSFLAALRRVGVARL